jgi:hypothetical protein
VASLLGGRLRGTLDSMNTVPEPPFLLDSARVLMYTETGGGDTYTGKITVHANGKWLEPVPRLAICENLVGGDILLFHCDGSWNVLAAGGGRTLEEVKRTAERAYSGVSAKWVTYRSLTPDEVAEVEAEREELKGLAAQLPTNEGE